MEHSSPLVFASALLSLASCQSASSLNAAWGPADRVPLASAPLQEPAAAPSKMETAPVAAASSLPPERSPNIYRKLGLRVGGVAYGSFDTTVQVRGESGLGTIIDFEDLLGVKGSSDVLRFDGFYAFNDRHRVDISYYDITRTGVRTLDEDVEIGDVIIPAGDTVSTFGTEILKLDYRYSFVADPRTVLAASFGFHVMRIDLGLKSQTFDVEETLGVTAPLPVIGLHGAYALSDSWSILSSGELFQIQVGDFGGTLSDFRLGVNWDIFDYLGLGVEINAFNMSATVKDSPLEAEVEYGYSGIGIYLRGYL